MLWVFELYEFECTFNYHKTIKFSAAFDILQIKKKFKKSAKFDYDFDDWNRDAILDGWVCRNDQDCTWIDENLGCNDYEFNLDQIQVIFHMVLIDNDAHILA